MAPGNRPRGREKNIGGVGKSVYKRGSGLGSGPVGSAGGYSGRGGNRSGGNRSGGSRGGGKGGLLILLAALLLGGGGAGVSGLFGGEDSGSYEEPSSYYYEAAPRPTATPTPKPASPSSQSGYFASSGYSNALSSLYSNSSSSSGWDYGSNTGKLDTDTHPDARDRYCAVSDADDVTVMVYMCGTDLESQGGMASSDLQEMTKASISDKVNVLVYTGGCASWQNSIVSSSVNQIYKVESGGLRRVSSDAGNVSMTKPDTLSSFIRFCAKSYPADRYQLILWDHGSGAISGFGYDQKFSNSGSMSLSGINEALRDGGVKFDFIGFDACLMATTETAFMLNSYADYVIASEETEPGTGWYYSNWLSDISKDPSISTVKLGKRIVDDFVDACAQQTRGQKTTLSVVDLAELSATVPALFSDFADGVCALIEDDGYKTVSNARSAAREFSTDSRVDHVDLVHLARKIGSEEGEALAEALLGAVKYNRTSSNMTNAYGLSIYFPYRQASTVKKAVAAYEAIGMDSSYTRCIQSFANYQSAGQSVYGGSSASPYSTLFDYYSSSGSSYDVSPYSSFFGSGSSYDSYDSYDYSDTYDMMSQILESIMGSYYGSSSYYGGRSIPQNDEAEAQRVAQYVSENFFDASNLLWTRGSGGYTMVLPEEQWSLVHDIELNVFVDDGKGFIDLGLDNVFDFNEAGELLGGYDGTWLAINEQPVAYYHVSTVDDGEDYSITGRVPVLLNGQRADLILVFDNENPYGYVAGARFDYRDGETETVAKALGALKDGDEIDFLCDYYSYDGEYLDSYMLGDRMVVDGELEISNVYLQEADCALPCYRITDMYHNQYWTPILPQ